MVPTLVVLASILVNVLLGSVEGVVRRGIGQIGEERFGVPSIPLDKLYQAISISLARVEVVRQLFHQLTIASIDHRLRRGQRPPIVPVAPATDREDERFLESPGMRTGLLFSAEVPLA